MVFLKEWASPSLVHCSSKHHMVEKMTERRIHSDFKNKHTFSFWRICCKLSGTGLLSKIPRGNPSGPNSHFYTFSRLFSPSTCPFTAGGGGRNKSRHCAWWSTFIVSTQLCHQSTLHFAHSSCEANLLVKSSFSMKQIFFFFCPVRIFMPLDNMPLGKTHTKTAHTHLTGLNTKTIQLFQVLLSDQLQNVLPLFTFKKKKSSHLKRKKAEKDLSEVLKWIQYLFSSGPLGVKTNQNHHFASVELQITWQTNTESK